MTFSGKAFVLGDNIDTDQIIPAHYLTLVPTIPEEYRKLGTHALSGLPDSYPRFIAPGAEQSEYTLIVAGKNFGCGSSREHAPVALGAAGVKVVVAASFARIFFRNCIATGELYPVESRAQLSNSIKTGDQVTVDLAHNTLLHEASGVTHELAPLGDAYEVIREGGIFAFARARGMIGART